MTVAFYGDDLAHAHSAGYGALAEAAADRLVEEFGRAKGAAARGTVVELGCGPGITAARLLAERFEVVGFDISPAMVDLARANAPRGEFAVAGWADVEIPPCDAVIAVGEVLNYVAEKGTTLRTLERLFGRVFRALWPGGVFMFDMAGPGRVADGGPVTATTVGDDWATIVTATEDRRGMLTREITTLRKSEDGIRVSEETHVQRLVPAAKVQELLRKAGFRVRLAQGYRGERFAPGHSVFIARRP